MRSCGDERYGLICHSKYTNPTVTADTRTKCMDSPPLCRTLSDAGNRAFRYGYREMGFQATDFKILDVSYAGIGYVAR